MRAARGPRINPLALEGRRLKLGLSQTDLGRRAGVHPTYIGRLEAGLRKWPHPRITKALADALGVEVTALLAANLLDGHR